MSQFDSYTNSTKVFWLLLNFILGFIIIYLSMNIFFLLTNLLIEALDPLYIYLGLLPMTQLLVCLFLYFKILFLFTYFTELFLIYIFKYLANKAVTFFSESNNGVVKPSLLYLDLAKKIPAVVTSPQTTKVIKWLPRFFVGVMTGGVIFFLIELILANI